MKDQKKIVDGIRLLLEGIGEDPSRPGLRDTPERVSDFWLELTDGYGDDPKELLTLLPGESHPEVVVVRGIEFSSVCEHHLAPFFGICDIAYLPGEEGIVGISKLGRLVDLFSRRLQVQERLTSQIADALHQHARAKGVLVRVHATHSCMTMRGVRKSGSQTVTLSKRGVYDTNPVACAEALGLF